VFLGTQESYFEDLATKSRQSLPINLKKRSGDVTPLCTVWIRARLILRRLPIQLVMAQTTLAPWQVFLMNLSYVLCQIGETLKGDAGSGAADSSSLKKSGSEKPWRHKTIRACPRVRTRPNHLVWFPIRTGTGQLTGLAAHGTACYQRP